MKAFLNFLKLTGFKTYIVGIGMIAHGIYLITEGQVQEGIKLIELGLAAMAGRAAIAKG